MNELYMGLMSGTSMDGISAVLANFSSKIEIIATHHDAFNHDLRNNILALCEPSHDEINRLGELDVLMGQLLANTAKNLLRKKNLLPHQIKAIGSHGQTIRHYPNRNFTLQIGDPNVIAAETNITTVADFRRRDIALGGQGAPLVPAFHQAVFASPTINRVIVNIGGIANITFLPAQQNNTFGFDTGPGNTLLDAWAMRHLNIRYDKNGEWASEGTVNEKFLKKFLSDEYFKKPFPKSTGREYFNLRWLEALSSTEISPVNMQATLVELTALSITDAIHQIMSQGEIYICGGGIHNTFLMSRIISLSKFPVFTTQKIGIDPDWIEALAFAWLAKQTLEKKAGNLSSVTGAKTNSILGGVYFV